MTNMNGFFILPGPVNKPERFPGFAGLLLRCLRFPELCPATVCLPEIFEVRRQAAPLIPSALPFADLLYPSSTSYELEGLGLLATLVIIKLYFPQKIKCNIFIIDLLYRKSFCFSAFFRNFLFSSKWVLIDTSVFFHTFHSILTILTVIYPENL